MADLLKQVNQMQKWTKKIDIWKNLTKNKSEEVFGKQQNTQLDLAVYLPKEYLFHLNF